MKNTKEPKYDIQKLNQTDEETFWNNAIGFQHFHLLFFDNIYILFDDV